MFDDLPDVKYGDKEPLKDWRQFEDEDPDDEELEDTPKDVIDILGFDPKDHTE